MERALAALGHPERAMKHVHVAGTNGKGSTCAFLERILRESGYVTGLFTSPHLSRFTERIRVCGVEIAPEEAVACEEELRRFVNEDLTFFEVVTLMALLWFRRKNVDIAVLETGMGGRFDATNVVVPEVAVITGVALDHTEYLGNTLAAIAYEKAGILKPGRPAIVGALPCEAEDVVTREAGLRGVSLWALGRDFSLSRGEGHYLFRCVGANNLSIGELGLVGRHQVTNAALALATAERLGTMGCAVPLAARQAGVAQCSWPGRLERLREAPEVWVDGAHNPDGARALAGALAELRRGKVTVCLGVLGDKDVAGIVQPLAAVADRVITVKPRSPRGLSAEALAAQVAGAEPAPSLREALDRATQRAALGDMCVVAGSLYLVGEARELLLGEPADPVAVGDPLGVKPVASL